MLPVTAPKPAGGFRLIPVVQLCTAWWCYRHGQIRLLDVRVWFAAQEMVARRCRSGSAQSSHYTIHELTGLVGKSRGASSAIARLTAVGLLTWSREAICFPSQPPSGPVAAGVAAMLAQVPNHRRTVPVPRRLVRFLAGGCRRVVLATVLGHLLRCLYYRQGQCRAEGFCNASWIAEVFEVSERAVKSARQTLEQLGLLERQAIPWWVRNAYGEKMRINLHWARPRVEPEPAPQAELSAGRETPAASARQPSLPPSQPGSASAMEPLGVVSATTTATTAQEPTIASVPTASVPPPSQQIAPPRAARLQEIAPPDSYTQLSSRKEYQKPAGSGAPGVLSALFMEARALIRTGAALRMQEGPIVTRHVLAPLQPVPSKHPMPPAPKQVVLPPSEPAVAPLPRPPLPGPRLQQMQLRDLRDTGRLLTLYEQAIHAKWLAPSEAERLAFVALAQHVLTYRPENAGGLFTHLVRTRCFAYITQADEDAAQQRLKRFLYRDASPPPLFDAAEAEQEG